MIKILSNQRSEHQLQHQEAFYKGALKMGFAAKKGSSSESIRNSRIACWGWRAGKRFFDKGCQVLVMERGYIGDRFKYASLGWNGLNNYASFPEYEFDNLKRFHSHGGELKPWKKDGDCILILGQVPNDASLKGKNLVPWYARMAIQCKEIYNLPVYFRPHPDCERKGISQHVPNTMLSQGDLNTALSRALFTVSYNSNSCLDSVMAGIPCYAGDKGTMAWDLCMRDLKDIITPERERIVSHIAWTQFDLEEISNGWPLEKLLS